MKESSNNQPVTKKDLDKTIEEHSKVIIDAISHGFAENKKEHQVMETKIEITAL